MQRELTPEILDSLPHDHPDALHNRRDLRVTNRLLGNYRWFESALPGLLKPADKILEIGSGTGDLAQRLARAGISPAGLDLWPKPESWPADRAWHRTDLLTFEGYDDYSVIIGNLIFHQFTAEQLATLGRKLQRTARLIVASEPVRRRSSQILFRAIAPLLGANHVSLHDAHVSVASGFRGDELPQMLGLNQQKWDCRCVSTLLGTYRMVATRR